MAYHKMFHSLFLLPLIFFPISISTDTITPIQSLKDGETLISAGENFALGFFSPGKSKNRYVGIWFNKIPEQTAVWVANRENPVKNSHGVLMINGGSLLLVDGGHNNSALWSTNISTVSNCSNATLTDSGNLVLTDDHQRILWESFDYPTDTNVPGMKLGLDRRTGLNRVLTSWKSLDDPAPGEFSLGLDPEGMPQFFLRKGSDPIWRSGPWNGQRLSGIPYRAEDISYRNRFVANDDEIYCTYGGNNTWKILRGVVDDSGGFQGLIWSDKNRQWIPAWTAVRDRCDRYANCGAYGSCDSSVNECTCLRGFKPKTLSDWRWRDWSDGCVRRRPLNCSGKGDGFLKVERVKVPDTSSSRVEPSWSLKDCEEECLKNCNCTAYATADISEGTGCVIWYGDLLDLKVFSDLDQGQDLYTRVAAAELDKNSSGSSKSFQGKKALLVTVLIGIPVMLFLYFCSHYLWKKAKGPWINERLDIVFNDEDTLKNIGKSSGLQLFNFGVIIAATDNFSESRLLGKGGFGPVYKGQLLTGQEIAVKRLSKNSKQGMEEFNNEVTLIAKLQHRNLVKLLGCCITGQERILVYEYMRNKSLDSTLFDQTRSAMLDWRKRFNIIVGIARGILYLHEDSRFRIIHRDLKVSNILLDDNMNPKISDFGAARIFGENQTQALTKRVVGTYGYMSPEYAIGGLFSVKSDAFSFGVMLLEIISGKRNNHCSDHRSMNLIGYVWQLWKADRVLQLVDSSLSISAYESEVLRCIQVGLLCIQEKAKDRPNMSAVIFMLGNETMMPSPKQPASCFLNENCMDLPHSSTNKCSVNLVTITNTEARSSTNKCSVNLVTITNTEAR